MLLVFLCGVAMAAGKCKRPNNLQQIWLESHKDAENPESYHIFPLFETIQGESKTSTHVKRIPLNSSEDITCPTAVPSGATDPPSKRSTCPWYHVVNSDPYRYPENLIEAACKCSDSCVGTSGDCHKLHFNVRVLKTDDECDANGYHVYKPSWEKLVTGCTCVRDRL